MDHLLSAEQYKPIKIYFSHATDLRYPFREVYERIKKDNSAKWHDTFILPHDSSDYVDVDQIFPTCNLIIADISYPSTGQGIELERARSLGIPIFSIHKADLTVSESARRISNCVITYKEECEIPEIIANVINFDINENT